MILTLPFPPSTNGLFTNRRGGRASTKRYLAWQEEAGWAIKRQCPLPESGPVSIHMLLGRPDKRKRDLDNLLKSPIDLLVKHGLIDDDRSVESIFAAWGKGPGKLTIMVAPCVVHEDCRRLS